MTAKTIPSGLQSAYDIEATTLAHTIKFTRTDGQVYAYTSASADVTISAVTYDAGQGLDVGSIVSTAGLAVDNLELTTLDDGTLFKPAEVLGRVWANAAFIISRYDWSNPAAGQEPLLAGTVGNVVLRQGSVVVELRGLQQYLQQPIGSITSKTCRARLADYPTQAGNNRCGLAVASWRNTLTVDAVTDTRTFTATGTAATTADYYGDGVITWLTGDNAGLQSRCRTHTAGRAITLYGPMPYTVQVGDTLQAVAGCRKRLAEDCVAKFANVLNFQGEPHVPMIDQLTSAPEVAG